MSGETSPLKVAICRNYLSEEKWGQMMVDSWYDIIHHCVPDAIIDLYHPIDGSPFPSPPSYNLIVLTGGVANLSKERVDLWVERTLEFIQATARDYPQVKLLGICWGHQAVARALGGVVGIVKGERVAGVQNITLTKEGKGFFGLEKDHVAIHKFHKRAVTVPPSNFISLASDNEILLSRTKNILTFQGHPEMTSAVARAILSEDGGAYSGGRTKDELDELYQDIDRVHDGFAIFKTVVSWAQVK